PVERVGLESLPELTEVVAQRGVVRGIEVDEDEARPHVGLDRCQAVVLLVEAEELGLLLHERELSVERIAPAVVLADELTAGPARLFAREVGPDELVAAMAADVVEGADLVVRPPHDDDRGARGVELLREVAAHLRELLHAADVQPGAAENGVALE